MRVRGSARSDGCQGGGQDHKQAKNEEQAHDFKSTEWMMKVKREIRILKFINHQNIIKLYEVLDTTNDIFVIMELAEGGELYDYIQNNDIYE